MSFTLKVEDCFRIGGSIVFIGNYSGNINIGDLLQGLEGKSFIVKGIDIPRKAEGTPIIAIGIDNDNAIDLSQYKGQSLRTECSDSMHTLFYNWILSQEVYWCSKGIKTEEIINLIDNPSNPDYPFVSVRHASPYALGQINLHSVRSGYIVDFESLRISDEHPLMYSLEFSESPDFELWQKRYVDFLHSGNPT